MKHRIYLDPAEIVDIRWYSPIHYYASKGFPVKPFTMEVDWTKCKQFMVWKSTCGGMWLQWEDY